MPIMMALSMIKLIPAAVVVATFTLQSVAFAQTPLWRDGSSDSTRQQLDDWREAARRNDLRERAQTDRVHDQQSTEQLWQWTDRTGPLALFGTPPVPRERPQSR
jgi:hypothetical protein